ncbi:MAG: HU family DNA-binding protein [Thermodesulfobacteriota bacterium]
MTKPEIVAFVSQQADISKKTASAVLDSLVMVIHESLKSKGKIKIASLGTFRVLDLHARRGVNPRTGDEMTIPAMRVPRFTPAKALRKAVKKQK